MSDLISETVRDIVSTKLGIRLSEELYETEIYRHREFENVLEEVGIELNIFIGDDDKEEIENVQDLIDVCERIQEENEKQRQKNG